MKKLGREARAEATPGDHSGAKKSRSQKSEAAWFRCRRRGSCEPLAREAANYAAFLVDGEVEHARGWIEPGQIEDAAARDADIEKCAVLRHGVPLGSEGERSAVGSGCSFKDRQRAAARGVDNASGARVATHRTHIPQWHGQSGKVEAVAARRTARC